MMISDLPNDNVLSFHLVADHLAV
uniref:Uncharacterized protein n=1 Tax=Arundo donax TaxID=35708 RepID=A0A0A8YNT1_ARUDO